MLAFITATCLGFLATETHLKKPIELPHKAQAGSVLVRSQFPITTKHISIIQDTYRQVRSDLPKHFDQLVPTPITRLEIRLLEKRYLNQDYFYKMPDGTLHRFGLFFDGYNIAYCEMECLKHPRKLKHEIAHYFMSLAGMSYTHEHSIINAYLPSTARKFKSDYAIPLIKGTSVIEPKPRSDRDRATRDAEQILKYFEECMGFHLELTDEQQAARVGTCLSNI